MSLLLLPACGKSSSESREAKVTSPVAPSVVRDSVRCGVGLDMDPSAAVATINGIAIPCKDLFERTASAALSTEAEFREQLRGMHKQGLAELIDDKLLQAAADEKKQSIKDFVAGTLSIVPTTAEEAKAFYEQAVARGEQLPPYESVTAELINFLNENKQKVALQEFRDGLRAKATLELSLPLVLPPKFEVEATGPSKGGDNAVVTIVEFSDFQCHFCGKAEPTVQQVLKEYGDKVRFVYRDYPLPNHPEAAKAAEAAHCAGKQGKYWELHGLLFANQAALGMDAVKGYAQSLGLNSEEFASCVESGEMAPVVVASLQEGEKAGVNGTPAFFVNGRILSGAQPFERFKEVIDHELANAGQN